jgi:hypothetical protein
MSVDSLKRGTNIAKHISEWLEWAEANHGEEFAYISDDLVQDLANYLVIMEES